MADDPLALFQAMRPPAPAMSPDIRRTPSRPVQTVGGARDLHDLAMVPGSAAYTARIPRPPCFQCMEDHMPGREYDHPWMAEPQPQTVHDEPVSASAVMRRPSVVEAAEPSLAQRVALYVGRNDTYVVSVEAAPDWDASASFKVQPAEVLPLIWLARALGVKISDKTGGDLAMLETEYVREHAQNNGRGAPSAGDRGPRLAGPDAPRPQEGGPLGVESENAQLPEPGGER